MEHKLLSKEAASRLGGFSADQLDKAGIRVAQYMTELPPRELLLQQIKKSLELAKELNLKESKEE